MTWREEAARLPNLSPAEFVLNPETTGLLVIDMQYVDAHRDHGLGKSPQRDTP